MAVSEQQVPEDSQRCWLAVAGSNDGVWDWHLQKGEVFFSDRWKSMLGFLPGEVGNALEEWRSRVHPDDLAGVMQVIERHLAGDTEHFLVEYRMRHKYGHYLWISGRGQALFDAAGEAVRMTGFHTDVTERHMAEEAVQSLSEELQTILNLSPDGFVAFDRLGKVRYLTPAFEGLTLLRAKQVHGLDEDQFWALLASLSLPASTLGQVAVVRHTLGQPATLRRSLIELATPAGRVLLVSQGVSDASTIAKILCFRDVSYETEMERLKSEFLSTAAHELRTPLASIYGFTELLLDEADATVRKEFTDIVYKQAQTMTHMLNEMLDLACIEARRHTDFVFTCVSAGELVQSVLAGFKLPAGREAPVVNLIDGDLCVRVDVGKASQVVLNVLSNAYKYSPAGGPVTVRIESLALTDDESMVVISICDRGIGMKQDDLARVFDRFYRVNPASDIPGTGLGLSIVKEVMKLLNGYVEIDSRPGSGTCVALFIPSA
jgi:PAS domain S-box-containing protein